MRPHFSALSFCAAAGLLLTLHSQAQTKNPNTLLPPPADIKIDGDLKDWGDTLRYFNDEKKISYTLANDKDNLYMVVRVSDRTEQIRIIRAGLTLSINTKGKKKEESSITFPVGNPDQPQTEAPDDKKTNPDLLDQQDREEMLRAKMTKLRYIKVTGLPDIESDIMTTSNTYGIKVALNIDDKDNLVYEAAIPLKFFHAAAPDKTEWAFNIKINGVTHAPKSGADPNGGAGGGRGGMGGGGMGGGGGRGGMGGGGGRHGGGGGMGGGRGGNSSMTESDHSEIAKSMDFWEKFYLGKSE
ncbi:hypothetical protein [Mucilaginibacter jinjuensis]|uniref:Outer membrane lipoprotein-sorting protein n=1 Tax=Mucilaginibacter jinjuensis TaxID=1176721 RepID=A0ABY7T9H6_9SPHI|nr:hypothetical protein [Mucilaginibacter jinjuensis]WCT12864.1 hypothetical protein PQO05_02815 [Mucilaginibacter jinjuensis]